MRSDLLYSQACIDWTIAQFPAFQERIYSWLDYNVDVILREIEANPTHDLIVAVEKEPFPLSFSVEAGAYINAIRSSLDIMATALAHRFGIPRPDKHHFPVTDSVATFATGKGFKGHEFINALPNAERSIIESLKPYKGGNDHLWALHQLNNMSKHQRLLTVDARPAEFHINGWYNFIPIAGPGFVKSNGETALGFLSKGASNIKMQFIPHVTLDEFGILERKPIVPALNDFACHAASIIKLFDY